MNNIIEKLGENFTHNQVLINRDEVIKALNEIRKIIFLGYYEPVNNVKLYVESKIALIKEILSRQIFLSCDNYHEETLVNEIIDKFINTLPLIKQNVDLDVNSILLSDPAAECLDEVILSYPGVYAITTYRIAHELYKLKVPKLPRIMSEYAHSKTGIDIHPGAEIGKSFFIDHGTGIVIGETTTIGNNVKIYQGVTLGALSLKDGYKMKGIKRHPTICDNVTIYAGASILGGETVINENVTIGGNVFITKSIDANKTVILKNQEIIEKSNK